MHQKMRFMASLIIPRGKAKNMFLIFIHSAHAAVGANGIAGGGRTADPGDHTRNDGRATRVVTQVKVQIIPSNPEKHINRYEMMQNATKHACTLRRSHAAPQRRADQIVSSTARPHK